jgi:SMODS-associating 4TM effector domain
LTYVQGGQLLSIAERQNSEYALRLNKASRVINQTAVRIEAVRGALSLLLVVVAIVFAALGRTEPALAVAGFVWALVSTVVIVPWSKQASSESAAVQEHFDTYVFALPWNSACVTKLEPERITALADRFTDDEADVRDWYPDTAQAARPFDMLLCQRANLMWDISLRELWARVTQAALAIWVVTGLVIGVAGGLTVWTILLRWYVPSSAAILLAFEIIRAQRQTANERKVLLATVKAELDRRDNVSSAVQLADIEQKCREIQDGIFDTRKQVARVPSWLYKLTRQRHEARMRAATAELGGVGVTRENPQP